MANPANRLAQQWVAACQACVALDVDLTRHGANRNAAIACPNIGQLADVIEVDQQRWPGQSEIEERNEALATRQHLGVAAASTQRCNGLVERAGRHVLKRGRLHRSTKGYWIKLMAPASPTRAAAGARSRCGPRSRTG